MGFRIRKVSDQLADYWTWEVGRFWFALTHLLSGGENGRMAREDIGHAYINLFVEGWRALSYLMGHLLGIFLPWLLIALVWK